MLTTPPEVETAKDSHHLSSLELKKPRGRQEPRASPVASENMKTETYLQSVPTVFSDTRHRNLTVAETSSLWKCRFLQCSSRGRLPENILICGTQTSCWSNSLASLLPSLGQRAGTSPPPLVFLSLPPHTIHSLRDPLFISPLFLPESLFDTWHHYPSSSFP